MQAFNFTTMTVYGGSNAELVSNGSTGLNAFATFNQIRDAGHMVKKGAKSIQIFCGFFKKEDPKNPGKMVTVPRGARVFDIVDTTAADDKDFLKWLASEVKAGRLKKSGVTA